MTRRSPKEIGTHWEADVRDYLRERLEDPAIDRLALHGRADIGDVGFLMAPTGERGVVECKAAKQQNPARVRRWQAEMEQERLNAGVGFALLVLKTPGVGRARLGRSRTYVTRSSLSRITGHAWNGDQGECVELDLETVCSLLECSLLEAGE